MFFMGKPCFLDVVLACWHVGHAFIHLATNWCIPGQSNLKSVLSIVLFMLWWWFNSCILNRISFWKSWGAMIALCAFRHFFSGFLFFINTLCVHLALTRLCCQQNISLPHVLLHHVDGSCRVSGCWQVPSRLVLLSRYPAVSYTHLTLPTTIAV